MIPRNLRRKTLPNRRLLRSSQACARANSTSSEATNSQITSILIANRGEIALRVSRTASEHGIRTTTIFTDPDAKSQHTLASPFSANLGDASAYLDGEKIVNVAKRHGCDAVHPGYGFLSENAPFARLCANAGLNFIGPSWQAIEAMGDKSRSKEIMLAANVPCIPGYHGSNQDPSYLQEQASQIGYPVLLKAVHGGGGKGMRIVDSKDSFVAQLESAKSEAQSSFGNSNMLVEKYISRPRHVEVQVFGDKLANFVALGERDCSIQRRHQKIIEESPAPGLSMTQRKILWQKAIQAAKAVNYTGAGTVEFILDADTGDFYFMEMNTRLQVEHPVTEMCTGLDLVEWQLRVARGERLPLTQAEIEERVYTRGHAVEARIYAEDPELDFLPTAGTLTHLRLPQEVSDSVRIDTAITQAPTTISSHYDPMISKLIVRAPDRLTALKKMKQALEEYEVAGLATNIEFLKRLCANKSFIAVGDDLETSFIQKHKSELFPSERAPSEVYVQAALGLVLAEAKENPPSSNAPFQLGFKSSRSSAASLQPRTIHLCEAKGPLGTRTSQAVSVSIRQDSADSFTAALIMPPAGPDQDTQVQTFPSISATASQMATHHSYSISTSFPHTRLISTLVLPSLSDPLDPRRIVTVFDRGQRYDLSIPTPAWLTKALGKSPASVDEASVAAPMPSKILRVEVRPGDTLIKDQPLVVVESMKMEMVIRAPREGLVVKKVVFDPGEICKAGAALVEFEDLEAPPREK